MKKQELKWYSVRAVSKDGSSRIIDKDLFCLSDKDAISVMIIHLEAELLLDSKNYLIIVRPKPGK